MQSDLWKPAIVVILIIGGALMFFSRNSNTNPVVQDSTTSKKIETQPEPTLTTGKDYSAIIKTSNGDMTIDLFAKETPITVNNFVSLAKKHFYDGTRFHRIIKNFMIQGGDPLGNGTGGPGYKFNDEPITRDYVRGTLAMANSGPDTNGSQFFIMTQDTPLPKNYVIFGLMTSGFDTLDKIANTPVRPNAFGEPSDPTENVIVKSIEIVEE